jgi:PKD repeat protein
MEMLRLYIIISLQLLSIVGFAQLPQNLRHSSELFLIEKGTDVKIRGGLESVKGNTSNNILNLGNIYVSDSISNYGSVYIFGELPDTLGHVYLDGGKSQKFSGKAFYFSNLTINNSEDTVFLHDDTVYVTKKIHFQKGKIDVGGGVLHLKRTSYAWGTLEGELDEEDSSSYVFGAPGYIKMYRPLTLGTTYENLHHSGIGLTVNGNLGARTEIRRYHVADSIPSNGSIARQFQFYPQSPDVVSDVKMHYIDTNGLQGNTASQLAVFTSGDNGSTWRKLPGIADTVQNKVESSGLVALNSNTRVTLSEGECDILPPVSFSRDTFAMCNGRSIILTADSIGTSEASWSTNVTQVNAIQVSTAGKYWIQVRNESGCINTDTCVVVIAPDPEPGFFVAPHCVGDSAFFNDTSKVSVGTISYFWDFGDPFSKEDTSSLKTPKFVYTKFGTYPARVTVTSNRGCAKSISRSVVILPTPNARFAATDTCADSSIVFVNNSTVTGGAGITYWWGFGDGDTSILTQPNHSFSKDSTYNVQLVATSKGCTDTTYRTVEIYPNPVAKFVFSNSCPGSLVEFIDSSRIDTGSLSYAYNFGNGVTSVQQHPNTVFATAGDYYLNLTVTSNKACVAYFKDTIVVNPSPSAAFSTNKFCQGDSIEFVNNTAISSGTFNSFWTFGDGDTSRIAQSKHRYTNAGQYTSYLVVVSDSGCVDSVTKAIDIFPKPKAGFTFSKACERDSITFSNSSVINKGSLSYKWHFGNSDSSSLAAPKTLYSSSGNKSVLIIASSSKGCSDSLINIISVKAKPIVALGSTIATCGKSLGIDANNSGATFIWNNGKNTQTITAFNSGFYWVKVTNSFNCETVDSVQVLLNTKVQPQLGLDRSICDSVILTSGYGSTTSSALWNGGSTNHNFSVKTSGMYSVRITDPNNCIGFDTVNITVNQSPSLNLGNDIVACSDSIFSISSNVSVPNYKWSTGATSQQIIPTKTGLYQLTVTDVNACTSDDEINVTLNTAPRFNLGVDQKACDSLLLQISANNATYIWKSGSTGQEYLLTVTEQIWATATSGNGCEFSDTIDVEIKSSPPVDLGNDTTLCYGDSLLLKSKLSIGTFNWSVGGNASSYVVNRTSGIRLNVTDTNQCTGSDSVFVKINNPFTIDLGKDEPLCLNSVKELAPKIKNATYNWGSNNGFSSIDSLVSLNDTGFYWLKITNEFGCEALDTMELLYTSKQANSDFLSIDEILIGDTVAFINLSNPTPEKQLWIMHDGYTSNSEHLTFSYFQTGKFDVKLVTYNSICTDTLTKQIIVKQRTRSDVYEEVTLASYNAVESLKVYPNPTRSYIDVEFELTKEGDVVIELFNMQGRLIYIERKTGQKFLERYELSSNTTGMYFIRVITGSSSKVAKFIKVN